MATYNLLEPILSIYKYPKPAHLASIFNSVSCAIGFFGTLGTGMLVDKTKKFKVPIFVCSVLTVVDLAVFTWFGPDRLEWLVGILILVLGVLIAVTMTVSVELGCEIAYPVPEQLSGGVILIMQQIPTVIIISISSALFDSSAYAPLEAAFIVNMISLGLTVAGTLLILCIRGR